MTLRVFPVADRPGVHYSDDFNRTAAPEARAHQGIDIFAPEGTPVLAVDDGAVRFTVDPIGGLSFYLKAADGTTYYGTHLSSTRGSDRTVRAGEVLGAVGHDGNAAGTPDHLHFEVHPSGAGSVDPFSMLQLAERRASSGGWSSWLLALGVVGLGGYAYWYLYGDPFPDLSRRLARLTR